MSRYPIVVFLFFALLLGASIGCSHASAMRGKMKGLTTTVEDAEKNGAMRCAPRELAIAKSQLEFAEIDLSQGEMSLAQDHMAKAEPNAQAAFQNSPPDRCSSREFVEVAGPPAPPVDGDTDGDGIKDSRDQCLVEPEDMDGYLDDDGCPDTDNDADGIADDKDKCPNQAEDFDGFQDEDGCPDPDNDNDGVLDVNDECPNVPGPASHRGCPVVPDADRDGDGIPDMKDKCPDVPEDRDGVEDTDGCPDTDNDHDGVLDKDDQCPNDPGPASAQGCPVR
jgi:OOP family OmpA-OmpF porin